MYLTDDLSEPTQWQFPAEGPAATTTILPKGYLLVWLDGDTAAAGLHAGFSLSAKGEEIGLFDAHGTLVDAIAFGRQTADVSFGRTPDGGPELGYFEDPTPGARNGTAYLGEVQDPLFSHCRGYYDSGFDLTLVCPTPGATILYTTDGTDPQHPRVGPSTAKVYTSPIPIVAPAHTLQAICVRAVAAMNGWKSSRVVTRTYVLNATAAVRSLPLISLVGDPGQTFYEPNGVAAIVGGTFSSGAWQSTGAGAYNNILNPDLERPVSFEWIEPSDSGGFQVDCGLRVHGSDWTRPRYRPGDKFSWRLCFRGAYGLPELDYPLFPFEVHTFDDIVLRAGHNDTTNPFIKDELIRRLFKDMGQVSCGGTLANLFINGQDKGYYNPTEHIDESFCQAWFDSNQPWDVISRWDVRAGDATRWNSLIDSVQQANLADKAAYGQVLAQVDMGDFVDYLILRLWSGDLDWLWNNWVVACERSSEGKWHFFVWDAEASFPTERLQFVDFASLDSLTAEHAYLWRALVANPRFKMLFGDRVYRHFYNGGALTTGNVTRRFNELRTQMAGVLPDMDTYVADTWAPRRPAIFVNACVQEGVYTSAGPAFLINGRAQYGGPIQAGDVLTMTTDRGDAVICYTLDGADPGDRLASDNFGQVKLMTRDAAKRVLVPAGPVDVAWRGAEPFDDSAWLMAGGLPGGVGFGPTTSLLANISLNTAASMSGLNASCLIRIPFDLPAGKEINSLTLGIQYDAGFVAYLNGVEVARRAFTGEPAWNSRAASEAPSTVTTALRSIDISAFCSSLRSGQNILAIQGMNSSNSDSDFLINAELAADVRPPKSAPEGLSLYRGPVRLNRTVTVRARAWVPGTSLLSALSEATFVVGPAAP
jgi:hypothetical protein